MKKAKILLLISLVFIIHTSYSQIKLGGKLGIGIGNLTDNSENIYSSNFKTIPGYDFGITSEFLVSNSFAIRAEILATRRGGKRNGLQAVKTDALLPFIQNSGLDLNTLNQIVINSGGTTISDENPLYADYNSKSQLSYIEIPVLGKYNFGTQQQFYLEAGPYIGFLTKAEQVTEGTSLFYADSLGTLPLKIPNPLGGNPPFINLPEQSLDATTDVSDNLESFNYGIHAGFGYVNQYNANNELFLGLRASYGFRPLQKDKTFGQNRVGAIVVSLGYNYIFSKK
ncbi:MAG: outer membrane beta-barrel protein [Polaribacter sp.]